MEGDTENELQYLLHQITPSSLPTPANLTPRSCNGKPQPQNPGKAAQHGGGDVPTGCSTRRAGDLPWTPNPAIATLARSAQAPRACPLRMA